jgi:hypothetical protein
MNVREMHEAARDGIGIASLFVEGSVLAISAFALRELVPKAQFRAVAAEVSR